MSPAEKLLEEMQRFQEASSRLKRALKIAGAAATAGGAGYLAYKYGPSFAHASVPYYEPTSAPELPSSASPMPPSELERVERMKHFYKPMRPLTPEQYPQGYTKTPAVPSYVPPQEANRQEYLRKFNTFKR